jgi:SPFH domain / Band 7 family
MFGFRFIRTEPTKFVILFRNGRARRAGAGLAFWYFEPSSSIVVVPTASVNEPFIFPEVTADFQDVTVQGQVAFRVADPARTAALLNFTLAANGDYVSEDPQKLSQRLLDRVRVAMRAEVQALPLKEALSKGEALIGRVARVLGDDPIIRALGLEVLGLSLLAIKPKPETAKALEAGAREALLRQADEAIYARRNAAVEQERTIKENELATEIAVENKKRQVREAQMEAERSVKERQLQIRREEMTGNIGPEEQDKALVALASDNSRQEADAKAYGLAAMMKAFGGADPKVLQALASVGMEPANLMALAFRDLADNAAKIGQLNVSPDLLREMLQPQVRT